MHEFRFDERAAGAAVGFFPRYLRHTEAEWAGRPFQLRPWQADDIIRPLFGWKRPDGTRRYRQAYIEVPRKNGKTELAAGISLLCLLGDGEIGGQGYSMAVDKDQAKIVFNKAGTMVQMSEDLARAIEVFKTSLYCPELMASFKPLSSGPAGKHGFSPSFAIGDEVHEWPDGELQDVVHKGTVARSQPLEIYITTAGLRGQGFAWEMHEYALGVLAGEIDDPAFLAVIYAAGEDDDWKSPATWAKANPNYGVSVKIDYLEAECRKAARSPRLENDFRRFHLNQWTEQVTRWLPMDRWRFACSRDHADPLLWQTIEPSLVHRECYGGVDLGSTSDLTALSWVFPPSEPGGRTTILWRFWLPEASLDRLPDLLRRRYEGWVKAGALTLTPGNVTDYAFIKARILEDCERFQVKEIAIDRWNATQVAVELGDEGLTMVLFGQGFASMSAPSKELERLVIGGAIEHGNHPVASWMAQNAATESDAAGNIKPVKHKSAGKIDGIVAAVMGLGRATAASAGEVSFWESAGR